MNVGTLDPTILDVAQALGLVDASGNLDLDWFGHPIGALRTMLRDDAQRAAVLDLLDRAAPPDAAAGAPAGEKWHPLLGSNPHGNAYVTVHDGGGVTTIGVALRYATAGTIPAVSVRLTVPCVAIGDGGAFTAVTGTAANPISAELRVAVALKPPLDPIALSAVRIAVVLAPRAGPPSERLEIVLEGLDLDGSGPRDRALSADGLDGDVASLVFGLIRATLAKRGAAGGEASSVSSYFLPLLGLGDGLPPFPLSSAVQNRAAVQQWLAALSSDGASMTAWLTHLAGLFGAAGTVTGSGAAADPWRVSLSAPGSSPELALRADRMTDGAGTAHLRFGFAFTVVPSGPKPAARLEADVIAVSFPLSGTGSASALPGATVALRAPGDATPLVPGPAPVGAGAVRAGLLWDGSALVPLLEVLDVTFGAHYERVDLTNADSVAQVAAGGVRATILAALGAAGAGAHIAALAALIAPASDPAWPATQLADPALLVSSPAAAIAKAHRATLLSTAHDWHHLFDELTALLGVSSPAAGSGTADDPWRAELGATGPLSAELAVWNAHSGAATDPQLLRIGVRFSFAVAPWSGSWQSELLGVDLPASGSAAISLLGAHALRIAVDAPATDPINGTSFAADRAVFDLTAQTGKTFSASMTLTNLKPSVGATTIVIPLIAFPSASPLDVTNPSAALGIGAAELNALARALSAWTLGDAFGAGGVALGILLGLSATAGGLSSELPLLGGTGPVPADPAAAWQTWLRTVVAGYASDGTPFIAGVGAWLAALLAGALPFDSSGAPAQSLTGTGTWREPWRLPLGSPPKNAAGAVGTAALLGWLEPDGPAHESPAEAAAAISTTTDFATLLSALRVRTRYAPLEAFFGRDMAALGTACAALETLFAQGDGLVLAEQQVPVGGTWSAGPAISSAHERATGNAAAITAILAQLATWAPGDRVVLLLAPPFRDSADWKQFLAAAEADRPGRTSALAAFDFRLAGVAPSAIDLRTVAVAADYYTADLADAGLGTAALVAQLDLVLARLAELRPGVPVTLIAHSTIGLAARAYAAAKPAPIRGLITLATPHLGAALDPIVDVPLADALRFLAAVAPSPAAGPFADVLDDLIRAADGASPPAAPGALPAPRPYPIASFAGDGTVDTGGVPAVAIAATLPGSLFETIRAALVKTIGAATAAPPTHLAYGYEVLLTGPPSTSELHVTTSLRVDAGRFSLHDGAPEPVRPAPALTVATHFDRSDGWLAGFPSAAAGDDGGVRVRRAEIGVTLTGAGGSVVAAPFANVADAALLGTTAALVHYGDPACDALLGAALSAATSPPPGPGSALGDWVSALSALGLLRPGPGGTMLLGSDGIRAMSLDPSAYFGTRLPAALAAPGGWFGAKAAPGGWTFALPGAPFEVFLSTAPSALELRTTGAGWTPAAGLTLQCSHRLTWPGIRSRFVAALTVGEATLQWSDGTLTLGLAPDAAGLRLFPAPAAGTVANALSPLLPRLIVASAASAFLDRFVGPRRRVAQLGAWLSSPVAALVRATALGDGEHFSAARIDALLKRIATALGLPAGSNPAIGPFELSVAGPDPVRLALRTVAPIGGVLSVDLGTALDDALQASATGSLTLHSALAGSWPGVTIAFVIAGSVIGVTVTPDGGAPIAVVPAFGGLGGLRGAATALLPAVLDAVVAALGPAAPFVGLSLDVARALDLYDDGGGFAAHTARLQAMLGPGWLGAVGTAARTQATAATAALFTSAASPLRTALPGTISVVSATMVRYDVAAAGLGSLTAAAGWDAGGATFTVACGGLELGGGALVANASGGFVAGSPSVHLDLALKLDAALGIDVRPQLLIDGSMTTLSATLLPLGSGTSGDLALHFLPNASFDAGPQAASKIARAIAAPLALDVAAAAAAADGGLSRTMWAGGPTVGQVLTAAGLLGADGSPTIPSSLAAILAGALGAVAPALNIDVASGLHVTGVSTGGAGLKLSGSVNLPGDDVVPVVRFGADGGIPGADGLTLRLFDAGGSLAPSLEITGVGVGLKNAGDKPLLDLDSFRLGGLDVLAFMTVDLVTAAVSGVGAGLELDALGLPLGLLGLASGSNPVAASLLGQSSGSGDAQPVNPAVDIVAVVREGSAPLLLFAGQDGSRVIPIPVHQHFGPLYIGQLELSAAAEAISLGIDGSLNLSGLSIDVEDLGVAIPLGKILRPAAWGLQLAGLAVAYNNGPLKIAGGLRENQLPRGIEYDGMLEVDVADVGFTAIGGYARPSDAAGGYTSLFIFASLSLPLGGPPFLFVTGLGAGFGYNRDLIVPDDLTQIDSFVLVEAIDNDLDANDPMSALVAMGSQIPPKRGEYWIAAGLRFTTFALVDSIVIVTVAFGDGFEVNVLGVSRMALPTEDVAIASIELALRARYSSAESLLSVQATLTDNCYLFSHDCELTGGFAFFMWFAQGQFVLTLGGYHPAFRHPANFPDVPRLGFDWHVSDIISIKGGAYFALTNTAVMAGASMEAAVDLDIIKAWFTTYMDILVSWDPFYYAFDVGVEIGFTVEVEICFFGCVHLKLTLKKGAQLELSGPPLHGTVTFDAYVTDITIPFGPSATQENYIVDFNVFSTKYLTAGDPDATCVDVHLSDGILPGDPPGAGPLPGTRDQPWKVGAGFAFATQTRMPASTCSEALLGRFSSSSAPISGTVDIAPMDELAVTSTHAISIDPVDAGMDTSWFEADHFTLSALPKPFPEGTWMHFDTIPARSGNITAYGGLQLLGQAIPEGQSALIPISSLVDDEESLSKPLPISGEFGLARYIAFGVTAETLAASVAGASTAAVTAAAAKLLSGSGIFSAARTAIGVAAGGLSPLANVALRTGRSAPPLLAPLATGLSRKPVALSLPSPIVAPALAPALPAPLQLRAVLQHPLGVTTGLPPAPHTTARNVSVPNAPRLAPPAPAPLLGARLHVVPAPAAPAATKAARDVRVVRNPLGGGLVSGAERSALHRAATDVTAGGVRVAAGVTHLWDVPPGATLELEGDSARVTCMNRAGHVLSDLEYQGVAAPLLHPQTAAVAVTCLGTAPVIAAPGSNGLYLSTAFGAAGRTVAVGWQNANVVAQIGAASCLSRGASLRLIRPATTRRNRQYAAVGMVRAADAVRDQAAIETRLPRATPVVLVLLDATGAGAVDGDFAIGARGATLATPIPVTGERRRALLYDVTDSQEDDAALYVTIASSAAWQLSGVVGLHGRAVEWATTFDGAIPGDLVADGPLVPYGSVDVRFALPQGDRA